MSASSAPRKPTIWWSNAIFFVAVHIVTLVGVYYLPPWATKRATLGLSFAIWQLSDFGITIGYHRLYSHKAFRACVSVRIVLALLGSSAFQGSIKWWCLRHRLHHRYTDDPVHDPYAATRGLFYSHMGWIFFKPQYERINLIEREDLESDPVVQFQHKYYVPLALTFGFILPIYLGSLWNDTFGGFVWGGLVPRILIWHCTFLVNSLAHWDGLQPYSDDDTSRGNIILALLTGGEGNHNFHAFPHDFRSGPSFTDWDPSKWIILALNYLGLVTSLRRAREDDIQESANIMQKKENGTFFSDEDDWTGDEWSTTQLYEYAQTQPGVCVVVISGYAVDVSSYQSEHPGGAKLLRNYATRLSATENKFTTDACWAFNGGLNNHSCAAVRRMRSLRIAKIRDWNLE